MIVLAFALVGGSLGAITARRRRGNRLDIVQYAAVYAIAFSLLGMIVTIVLSRSL